MGWWGRLIGGRQAPRGFLARLGRDTRANTLAIMAAALLPVSALAGSAVDMGRLYAVKVRLQQACDAGVLAGRKFLPVGLKANVALSGDALTQANTYFTANLTTSWLNSGWYTKDSQTFTPVTIADSQGNIQVSGTATVSVPMTLMQMFGFASRTLTVQCQASFSTPDTDVVFVLDTTGSMGCAVTRPESTCGSGWVNGNTTSQTNADGSTTYYVKEEPDSKGANASRIDALRQAVVAFYTTVSNTKDASTNVRYGFVPYTSTVNVGNLLYKLGSGNLVSSWSYQSRIPTADTFIKTVSSKQVAAADQNACNAYYSRDPATRLNPSTNDANPGYPYSGTATAYDPVWTPASGSGKSYKAAYCTLNTDQVGPVWTYQAGVQFDVSKYIAGGSIVDPSSVNNVKTIWNGCIEERDTKPGLTAFDQSNLPGDLDPDLKPTTDATRWRPMWPDVVYPRWQYVGTGPVTSSVNIPSYNDATWAKNGVASCPAQAMALFLPADKASGLTTITNYVNGLRSLGGTYHDIGMIWGTRMLSPTGIWAANNAWPAGRAAPKRVLVFVTDGTMSPSSTSYGLYGTEIADRRVTGTVFANDEFNDGKNNDGTCTDTTAGCYKYMNFHNQRFLAECAKAKSSPLNYDIWVVEVAQAQSAELAQCASRPSQVLQGQTTPQLKTAFQTIAQQVAMLRVSQ